MTLEQEEGGNDSMKPGKNESFVYIRHFRSSRIASCLAMLYLCTESLQAWINVKCKCNRVFRPFLLTTKVFLRDCSPGTGFNVPSPGDGGTRTWDLSDKHQAL